MPSGGQDRKADAAGVTNSLPPATVYDAEKAALINASPAIQLLQTLRHPGERIWLQTFADAPDGAYVREEKISRSGRPYTLRHWHVSGVPHDDGTTRTVNGIAEQYGTVTPAQLETRPYLMANLARVGVYFAVNSMKTDALRRKSDAVERVAAVFLDLDGSPLPAAFPIQPTAVVESSLGKYHVYWAVDGVPPEEFSTLQKTLAGLYSGDPVVHDLARVMRLPGYWHGKQDAGFLVQLVELNAAAQYTRDDLLTAWPEMSDALQAADAERLERQARAERLKAEAAAALSELGSSTAKDQTAARMKYTRIMLEHCRADLLAAPVGQRNSILNAVAFRVGRHLGAYLDGSEAAAVLSEAAEQIGLGETEIRDTLARALHDGQTKEPFDFAQVGTRAGKRSRVNKALTMAREKVEKSLVEPGPRYVMPAFPKGTEEGTDAANALILASNNLGDRLRYTFGVGWYVYDPRRGVWREDDTSLTLASQVAGQVLRTVLGQHVSQLIKRKAHDDELEPAMKWGRDVCNNWAVANALKAAAGRTEFLTEVKEWDARPDLLNCRNGVLELVTGQLLPHSPAHLLTWQTGAAFDPAARHEYVDQLTDLLKRDGRHDYLQRLVGSSLYGEAPNETATVLQGEGGTGKGTLVAGVTAMLGDYAGTVSVELLLSNSHGESSTGPKPELLKLRGKRLAVAGEPPKGARFNAGRVKGMTGNDPITARAMRSNVMVEFKPVFKLWIHTNYAINTPHDDTGMQRRLKVVPFNARPDKPYAAFKSTLENDPVARAALLNWAYEGFRLWHSSGFDLGTSAEIEQATVGYWKDQNPYEKFAAQCLTFDSSAEIPSSRLKSLFEEWAEENGAKMGRTVKMADLYAYLQNRCGCEPGRTKSGRFWYGVTEVTPMTPHPQVNTDIYTREPLNRGQAVTSVTSVTRDDVTPAVGWDGGEL